MFFKTRIFLFSALAVMLLMSCEDETITLAPSALGLDFYPVEMGDYWIYQVDSTVIISGGAQILESSSFIREEITGSFINEEGDTSFVLTISKAPSLDDPFSVTDVWRIEKSNRSVLRFEENLGFIKLVFPIEENEESENLLFNESVLVNVGQEMIQQYKSWRYKVLQRGGIMTVQGNEFTNILIVQQANNQEGDSPNDIENRTVREVYASGVGMIQREMDIFNDNQCGTDCRGQDWLSRSQQGFRLLQTLVEHN